VSVVECASWTPGVADVAVQPDAGLAAGQNPPRARPALRSCGRRSQPARGESDTAGLGCPAAGGPSGRCPSGSCRSPASGCITAPHREQTICAPKPTTRGDPHRLHRNGVSAAQRRPLTTAAPAAAAGRHIPGPPHPRERWADRRTQLRPVARSGGWTGAGSRWVVGSASGSGVIRSFRWGDSVLNAGPGSNGRWWLGWGHLSASVAVGFVARRPANPGGA